MSQYGSRQILIAAVEAAFVLCSLLLAFLLRLDFELPSPDVFLVSAAFLIPIRLIFLYRYNLIRGWWRYTGFNEAVDLLKAVGLGTVVFFVIARFLVPIPGLPRSVYAIEAVLTGVILISARLFSRFLAEGGLRSAAATRSSKLVVIIGAGAAADQMIKEAHKPGSGYSILCCLDDDASKRGISIRGVKIEGPPEMLTGVVAENAVSEIWIAIPSATSAQMSRFVSICEATQLPFKTLPGWREILADRSVLTQIRDVKLEDLLGRAPVELDLEMVREQVEGRAVMVTGAAGSIGSELCSQLLAYDPALLVCMDRNENGIFFLGSRLGHLRNAYRALYVVADVANSRRVGAIMRKHKIQVVFHAAAYKHVPVMENNIVEAVNNNIFALTDLLDTAQAVGCDTFVMISSDKAVNPTSVMGTTKRIGELILSSRPSAQMRCVSVRFGNVLGSNGSLVPILQEQIRRNEELTITHPEIKRFFMTIEEAVSLVLQAFTVGGHGDLLVLDMGEPIRIIDLAKTLMRLSGNPAKSLPIRITGLRDGEKLKEEMFYADEHILPTGCEKIKRTRSQPYSWSELRELLEQLRVATIQDDASLMKLVMQKIVPEYRAEGESPRKALAMSAAATNTPMQFGTGSHIISHSPPKGHQ
jgi:FlaA1/EpsC-like NDP-sugar epimerase